ncbi:hypothetical protein [Sphingomonas sp. GM_Shp_1]|uniref:hypothetical protein n=1 Tax=Sphingomonas sp. GM_Shp_1 TaxID=2937381 RepID=UPI00226BAAFD|nr:hypothetical protein [Sphingomonas sp. GM_Shp_1]
MERGLVDDDETLSTTDRAGAGRQGDDRIAGRQVDAQSLDALLGPVVVKELVAAGRCEVERLGEVAARRDELARHVHGLVAYYELTDVTDQGYADAKVSDEAAARAAQDSALASRISTTESTLNGQSARITEQATTIADHTGKLGAYWRVGADAGDNRVNLTVWADANRGGGVNIGGDLRVDGSIILTGTIYTNALVSNAVTASTVAQYADRYMTETQWDTERLSLWSTGGRLRVDMQFDAYASVSGGGQLQAQLFRVVDGNVSPAGRLIQAGQTQQPYGLWVVEDQRAGLVSYFVRFNRTSNSGGHQINSPQISIQEFKR